VAKSFLVLASEFLGRAFAVGSDRETLKRALTVLKRAMSQRPARAEIPRRAVRVSGWEGRW
jgi:hypothetical protein